MEQAKARWAESVRDQAGRENCDDTFKADEMASGLAVELSAALGSARCLVLPTAVTRPPNLNGRSQSAPAAQRARARMSADGRLFPFAITPES